MALKKAVDPGKDQSYVLFGMGQHELAATLMPVGRHTKDAIRRMALEAGFSNADKADSQDICFIPFGDYKEFIKERVRTEPGDIVDEEGAVLGRHQGIEFYTVGQRRGLGLSGGEPRYVLRLEPETNRVVAGPEAGLYGDRVWLSRVNYVLGTPPAHPVEVSVKIRYRSDEAPAVLQPEPEGALLRFDLPQRAVTPGQAAVFYQGDLLVGGGIIEENMPGDAAHRESHARSVV
jgi:tRNA-specific 2-thiouridylase